MAQYRFLIVSTLLGAALLAPGCGRSQEAAAPAPTPREETAALMEKVAEAEFQPPADGRLTEGQLQLYLEVRERQQEIRREALDGLEDREPVDAEAANAAEVAHTAEDALVNALEVVGDHEDPALADLQAASELGYNPKEYLWVREQVREAQLARAEFLLSRRLADSRERHLAGLEAELATAATPETRAEVEARLTDFRRGLAEALPQVPPAVQFNARLLDRYEERLAAVWAGEERWAASGARENDPASSKRGAE